MMFGRTSRRERRRLMERLVELRHRYQMQGDDWATLIVDGFIIDAAHGKDREKLGMEWAEKCEEQVRQTGKMRDWAMRMDKGIAA